MQWPLIYQKENENVWVSYAKQQMYSNNCSLNLVVVGPPGVGKSWATLSYLSALDPTFNIDRVHFRASKLLSAIQDEGPNRLKKGQAIMLDECGIDLNSLAWQNELNRGLNLVFQTLRFRNLTTALTLPYTNFLSKGVRTLMTAKFRVQGWSKSEKLTTIKPLAMEFNPDVKDGKFYYKRILVQPLKGSRVFCDYIRLPPPPKELTKEYEKRKKEFTNELYNEIGGRIEAYELKSSKRINPMNLTETQREVLKQLQEGKTKEQIANERDCSIVNIHSICRSAEKRGVVIRAIRGEGMKILKYEVEGGDAL